MKKIYQYIGSTLIMSCFFSQAEVYAACTDVIVDYCDKGKNEAWDWKAKVEYTPCGSTTTTTTTLSGHGYSNYRLRIESGTYFSIGMAGIKTNFLEQDQKDPCPRGDKTFHVYCGGNIMSLGAYPYCTTDPTCLCKNPRTNTCTKIPESDMCFEAVKEKKVDEGKKPVEEKKN